MPKRVFQEDAMEVLYSALITGDSGYAIEQQEARGQSDLVQSEVLPRKINHPYDGRRVLESFGVVFGEFADDLFVYVTLPEGWRKQPTDHSLWSKLVDDQGRERASIFYKAAFYDREAFMSLIRRYTFTTEPLGGYDSDNYKNRGRDLKYYQVGIVTDLGVEIWRTEPEMHDYRNDGSLGTSCREWLNENFPDWEDCAAYWD